MYYSLNKNKFLTTVVLLVISTSILLYAYVTGITGVTKKNGFGCTCHNSQPSLNVSVKIIGPDTLMVNQSAEYSVTITGGPLNSAGVDIATSAGTLSPTGSDLRRDSYNGELTHSQPKSPSGGKVTFTFSYEAPSAQQSITLYAVGNSVNGDGINDSQDQWNFSPDKNVVILNTTGVKDDFTKFDFELDQNYPNPFNPSTVIKYSLAKSSFVTLIIYDILGREVTRLVNGERQAGIHEVEFSAGAAGENGSTLQSGIYFYRLKAGSHVKIMKMLLLK